jgi:hypothetical protein
MLAPCVRVVVCALALGAAGATVAEAKPSIREFQARLAPHGRWLDSAPYGRVWQPTAAKSGWNPYYDGHWEYTDVGQTWVSDYTWGAIPYHYGTWAVEPGRGWVWIPGDIWAPSWVVFRTGPDVIGWAPVAPGFAIGGAVVAGPAFDESFVFVPSHRFYAPRVRTCALPPSRTTINIARSKMVPRSLRLENHVVVNRSPGLEELRRATGRPVSVVRLESVKGLGPSVRREIQVDESRARGGVRVCESRMASVSKSAAVSPGATSQAPASTAYDARADAPRGGDPRGRDTAAARTAYEEIDPSRPERAVHQNAYDREDGDTYDSASGEPREASASDETRAAGNSETQSDRDARLLASREKPVYKGAHPAGKPSPATGRSSRSKSRS